ncbi:MAG: hypothetical protein OXH00_23675 [Candidatus Poribacteria bacterium]|nr:hypothetical protein [Candidatus Poribacteria bacterium]
MKHYKWIHRYVNSTGCQQMKLKLDIPVLLVGILLSLPLVGCGTILVREGPYEAPQLPRSELATIKIDTGGEWIQRPDLIVLRIDDRLALSEKIELGKDLAIDEVLVVPGKHNMSLAVIYEAFHEHKLRDRQILSTLSADVKAGGIYLLRGEFSHDTDGELGFQCELVDTVKDKVVAESRISTAATSGGENANITFHF